LSPHFRYFVTGMDCWSKKGLTASFLGISASFYSPKHKTALHFLLNLWQIDHPHTGEMIADRLCSSLAKWGIEQRRVLMVVTDNGANMIKAVRVAGDRSNDGDDDGIQSEASDSESEPSEDEDTEREVADDNVNDIDDSAITLHRFPCVAHTLQLVLKEVDNHAAYARVLTHAKAMVKKIRISSVATEKMINRCGKTVVAECTTRWNSNMFMVERLLAVREDMVEVFSEMKWDCFVASEWTKLDELLQILKPFKEHTNVMQTDKFALSNVIPVLLDLSGHLSSISNQLARSLLIALQTRFASLLNPDNPNFDPLPSAACLLDPAVASMLLTTDTAGLLSAAKTYICQTRDVSIM
jgi:hypothetical protein